MITDEEFARIVKYMKQKAGINLSEKRVLIQGRLDHYLQKNEFDSYSDFMNTVELLPTGAHAQYLLNALTTNHTYFWREYEQFIYLKQKVFPALKNKTQKSKDWRIWCAAASTGEEPYTLAMLCMDYLGLEHAKWDTKILATDIDTQVLEHAAKGIYTKDSVEQLPQAYVRRFFRPVGTEQYQVTQELKKEVIFRQFNLMERLPFRKPLHVVFLRNVMIYFDEDTKKKVLEQIYEHMEYGGYLFIGTTEAIHRNHGNFHYIQPSIYRK